jgi:hypothetical protein
MLIKFKNNVLEVVAYSGGIYINIYNRDANEDGSSVKCSIKVHQT